MVKSLNRKMELPYLIQEKVFDVSDWQKDQNFGVFPAGARAKDALLSPSMVDAELKPNWRYLLKRSQMRYPDQFWGEIIAYRIGALLRFDTPPTFVAYDRRTGVVGALVEWFYDDKYEHFASAGDFLQVINPDFDRRLGEAHNLQDIVRLMRTLSSKTTFRGVDWVNWWARALVFDALIGNTDRHQENWGFIYHPHYGRLRLAPLFDNGTSLGQDRFPELVQGWTPEQLDAYIAKGRSHVRWMHGAERVGLFEILRKFLAQQRAHVDMVSLIQALPASSDGLTACLADLVDLTPPLPFRHLTQGRIEWIKRNLVRRLEILKELLNEFHPPSV